MLVHVVFSFSLGVPCKSWHILTIYWQSEIGNARSKSLKIKRCFSMFSTRHWIELWKSYKMNSSFWVPKGAGASEAGLQTSLGARPGKHRCIGMWDVGCRWWGLPTPQCKSKPSAKVYHACYAIPRTRWKGDTPRDIGMDTHKQSLDDKSYQELNIDWGC